VLHLPDGLMSQHADSNVLLVRHFVHNLFTHVLHRLQPMQASKFHRLTRAGNPGAFSG